MDLVEGSYAAGSSAALTHAHIRYWERDVAVEGNDEVDVVKNIVQYLDEDNQVACWPLLWN